VARERIHDAAQSWRERGVNVTYRWRSNRQGYKAGAMAEAMDDIREYEHIGASCAGVAACSDAIAAIFDADFHPNRDVSEEPLLFDGWR
jgi:beta-mannan synthase